MFLMFAIVPVSQEHTLHSLLLLGCSDHANLAATVYTLTIYMC